MEEVVAVQFVEKELKPNDNGEFELISLHATTFRLHYIKRVPKHIWKLSTVEISCTSSLECALWVDTIREQLEKCKYY